MASPKVVKMTPSRSAISVPLAVGIGFALGAMLAGLGRRSSATEFVFLVGIPTMFAASAYAFLELWKDGGLGGEAWGDVALAFTAATVTGFVVVKWLLGYIKQHRFTGFALYRMVLGAALLLFLPAGD